MDPEELARVIAEKTGAVVNVTLKELSKAQKVDNVKMVLVGIEVGVESYHAMQVDNMRAAKKECLDIDDLKKLHDTFLEIVKSKKDDVEKFVEEMG